MDIEGALVVLTGAAGRHAHPRLPGDPPERVAAVILGLVRSGEPEAVLAPPGFGRWGIMGW